VNSSDLLSFLLFTMITCYNEVICLHILIVRFRIAAVYSNNDNKLGPNSARFHLHKSNNKNPLPPPILMHAEAVSPTAIKICWQVCTV